MKPHFNLGLICVFKNIIEKGEEIETELYYQNFSEFICEEDKEIFPHLIRIFQLENEIRTNVNSRRDILQKLNPVEVQKNANVDATENTKNETKNLTIDELSTKKMRIENKMNILTSKIMSFIGQISSFKLIQMFQVYKRHHLIHIFTKIILSKIDHLQYQFRKKFDEIAKHRLKLQDCIKKVRTCEA